MICLGFHWLFDKLRWMRGIPLARFSLFLWFSLGGLVSQDYTFDSRHGQYSLLAGS
jgi:hypothetical protein